MVENFSFAFFRSSPRGQKNAGSLKKNRLLLLFPSGNNPITNSTRNAALEDPKPNPFLFEKVDLPVGAYLRPKPHETKSPLGRPVPPGLEVGFLPTIQDPGLS